MRLNESALDQMILRSLKKSILRESQIRRIMAGDRLVHDLNIHNDTIEEALEILCKDFDVDSSKFIPSEYMYIHGGIIDTFSLFCFLNPVARYLEKNFIPIDIVFIRQMILQRKLPPT